MNAEELLKEALRLLWYADNGYAIQAEVEMFFDKLNYDFYNRENWKLNETEITD